VSAFKIGDRVLITGSHPWRGHTGRISSEFESESVPDLKWVVAIDGAGNAAVSERDIRPATAPT
jgi:hypothetical protein